MVFPRYMLLVLPLAALVAGCGSDNDDNDPLTGARSFRYQVTITNLSAGQPFSPAAVVIHRSQWQAFTLGNGASVELERLAESGDNEAFLAEAGADASVLATETGMGLILPGATAEIPASASGSSDSGFLLTWMSMPVNTNDGLVGIRGIDLSELSTGDTRTYLAITYDAGTEANSESADTVPGPAASGLAEGFNAARDDIRDAVYIHPGVVTLDDGLDTSTLEGIQRWHNPIARVRIERVQ
ncbi:spondin domain-containing protein [Marinobacter sp. M216]|uniref:Spondin domain-containing protein n=1 Tax=Marinobacter albus TaxID=3030833 RepID=A0ABT7HBM2_9GAMM|nr:MULTISPECIES: spondin domain-containing protein [unclassified Marinobacter]MBW7470774.1 spondin domain-containing protein [Marinobacter sp. F4218]MDK9556956.1 spondin domain-containing protein [Marinobacter sp. M216]